MSYAIGGANPPSGSLDNAAAVDDRVETLEVLGRDIPLVHLYARVEDLGYSLYVPAVERGVETP